MTQDSKQFAWHFIQLMFAVFLLFFLTVGLGKASADLMVYMNDAKVSKTILEWVVFGIGAPLATAFWCLLWIWFKKSEKHCTESLTSSKREAGAPRRLTRSLSLNQGLVARSGKRIICHFEPTPDTAGRFFLCRDVAVQGRR